jgi:D-galactarolactone cycloisomerase
MKISSIEPILIAVPYRYGGPLGNAARWRTMDTLIVKVETDAGITGWGEGFGLSTCATTRAALINLVAPLAIGRDASDIAGLMNDLQRKLHNCARSGPVAFALSGLDIALWDIAGKMAGMPLYRMLGGEQSERMPAYASLLRYGTSELVARNAAEAVDRGYTRIKLHEITAAEVETARRTIGPDIKLMVDTNCPWMPDEAVAMAKRLAPFDLLWLEEPVWPPEDYRAMARVRSESGVAVAAGENAGTLADFTQLMDTAKIDYLQPSVTKIGGITEMKRIVALAQSRGVGVAPHSPYFGPGLVASVHICAALPGQPPVERFYCDLEASPFGELVDASGGYMRLSDDPGLGLVVDEAVIARYRVD